MEWPISTSLPLQQFPKYDEWLPETKKKHKKHC